MYCPLGYSENLKNSCFILGKKQNSSLGMSLNIIISALVLSQVDI